MFSNYCLTPLINLLIRVPHFSLSRSFVVFSPFLLWSILSLSKPHCTPRTELFRSESGAGAGRRQRDPSGGPGEFRQINSPEQLSHKL